MFDWLITSISAESCFGNFFLLAPTIPDISLLRNDGVGIWKENKLRIEKKTVNGKYGPLHSFKEEVSRLYQIIVEKRKKSNLALFTVLWNKQVSFW